MVATTLELENVFEDFAKRLEAGITVEAIVLYGSYARGNAYEGSDIDVAVISPDFEGVPTYLRQRTIAKHSLRRDGRISPIGYASSEYHDPPPQSFLSEIVRTGRLVYPSPAD